MNKYIKIISIFSISLMFILSACINYKFEEPKKAVYNPGISETSTINELKALHTDELTLIDTDVVIKGTVIANDKSGNIYKAIYIQDSTAGIQISLNAYELHNQFHVGDLIYVKCRGLYLGEYGGQVQLGADYEGAVGRIEEPLINDYLIKSDGGSPVVPKELDISAAIGNSLINEIVIIKNVQFTLNELGGTYADGVNHIDFDRHIEDCDGKSMIVRTSGYADFANDSLPEGIGTITAVLTKYNSDYQLIIRNVDEVKMNDTRCGAVFSETFDTDLGVFTPFSVIGDNQVWTYSSSYGAVMTGHNFDDNNDYANEDWLISSAIDLSAYPAVSLSFRHALNYITANGYNDTEVYICDDYDGVSNPNTSGSWTKLTGITYPPGSNWTYIDSGDVDISAFGSNSNVFIAFKYTSTNADACTWELDNISIKAQ
ncbi:MAG: OB-fold nucleic acid binding domain-containing protein [Bacteroidales bacterium]|nr:OB-fold nucleic acid binding domain-containing protein [Bacteroidales bacterium]